MAHLKTFGNVSERADDLRGREDEPRPRHPPRHGQALLVRDQYYKQHFRPHLQTILTRNFSIILHYAYFKLYDWLENFQRPIRSAPTNTANQSTTNERRVVFHMKFL